MSEEIGGPDNHNLVVPGAEPSAPTEPQAPIVQPDLPGSDKPKSTNSKLSRFKHLFLSHKKLSIPLSIVALLLVLMAIPMTRYALAGTVLKSTTTVEVIDKATGQPVSEAEVNVGGQTFKTNNEGDAKVKAKVGKRQLSITKKYYEDASQTALFTIINSKKVVTVELVATGRPVPVTVVNKINGQAVENASIKVADTEAKTDKDGKATVVVPADTSELEATLSADGFNEVKVTLKVTAEAVPENNFTLVQAGKIYFLSKQSGKIDVVKTNLDGSERQVVLAGTGKEDQSNTVLLASRNWKYLALHARRDSDKAKLYLIETASDKLTVMDEGDASFSLSGWSDNYFVYTVSRNTIPYDQAKHQALKSYNADAKQIKTLDESQSISNASGRFYTAFGSIYLQEGHITYNTHMYNVQVSNFLNKDMTNLAFNILRVKPDGSNKKVIKSLTPGKWEVYGWSTYSLNSYLSGPHEIYYTLSMYPGSEIYEVEGESIKQISSADEESKYYLTYLESPSGNRVFWYEERDGKNTLFLGNADAEDAKEVAKLSDYVTYGWYTDNYLLISKNGSELYILPADANVDPAKILKVSDYHKPSYTYYGYGGGYGGI